MGILYYADSGIAVALDDRSLAHVKLAMVNKLRRNESFTFSWDKPDGGGRLSFWVSAHIPIVFQFDDPEPVEINREWVQELAQAASSLNGLVLVPEPVAAV
jgi:hypothetical protein